ncbi:MAG: GNAT family N-acetyltransferase [Pseudomonadota bacterium]
MADTMQISQISVSDPGVKSLIRRHISFTATTAQPEHLYVLYPEDLADPQILLYGLYDGGALAAIGALRALADGSCEIKSMHVAREFRRRGLGRVLLQHLIEQARGRIHSRILIETGSGEAYEIARALYTSEGFMPCGAFGDYPDVEESAFFALNLTDVD